jgi:ElaB protein
MDQQNTNLDPTRHVAAGPGTTTPKDFMNRTAEAYDHTKETASRAYDKTSQALTDSYAHAMTYGRENPGKMTMIAFGIGFGMGLLVASSRRGRVSRYAEPLVTALSDIALDFVRHR